MALIVKKYGGTSVGSVERIGNVADRVLASQAQGHRVVVVVSAMSGETNRLTDLAHAIIARPEPREMDVLLSTGEQVTIALLSMRRQRADRSEPESGEESEQPSPGMLHMNESEV